LSENDRNKQDYLEQINEYLSRIDGINEYIIVMEGFPIYWGKDIDQSRAEELSALATDVINSTSFLREGEEEYMIVTLETSKGLFSVSRIGDLMVLLKGDAEIIRKALENIRLFINERGLKCPWCNNDLSIKPIKCPSGKHVLPFGLYYCPYCHTKIEYIKCPYCNKPVSPHGNPIVFKRTKETIVTTTLFGIITALMLFIGLILSKVSILGGSISVLSATILGILTYMVSRKKSPVELTRREQNIEGRNRS